MARKKSRRRANHELKTNYRQREYLQYHQADRLLPVPSLSSKRPIDNRRNTQYDDKYPTKKRILPNDRRLWTPPRWLNPFYGPKDERRSFVLRDRKTDGRDRQTKASLGIADYKRDEICIRRRNRRESLFARAKVGRGIKIRTRKLLTVFSKVRCK